MLLFALGAPSLPAHPIHASFAEADYRPESGKLEIALRLFADDTEEALSRNAGKKIVLGKTATAEIDALLLAYVRAKLVVKSREGAPQVLAWIGREFKDGNQHLWLYLECTLPGGAEGARIMNGVLRDKFSDQLNSVLVRDHQAGPRGPAGGKRQVTLLFLKDVEQAVVFPK